MNSEFQKLVKSDQDQVFLLSTRCSLPATFATHLWFVVNEKGSLSRWEVTHYNNPMGEKNWGHLVLNFLPPFSGLPLFIFYRKWFFAPKLLKVIEGDPARQIIEFIKNSPNEYPFKDKYHFTGPNSNTYAQWVLERFPEFNDVEIPSNAFGIRSYHKIVEK